MITHFNNTQQGKNRGDYMNKMMLVFCIIWLVFTIFWIKGAKDKNDRFYAIGSLVGCVLVFACVLISGL